MDSHISWNRWNTLASPYSLLSGSDCGVNGLGRAISLVLPYSVFCEWLCLDHARIQPVDQLLLVRESTLMQNPTGQGTILRSSQVDDRLAEVDTTRNIFTMLPTTGFGAGAA